MGIGISLVETERRLIIAKRGRNENICAKLRKDVFGSCQRFPGFLMPSHGGVRTCLKGCRQCRTRARCPYNFKGVAGNVNRL